MAALIAPRARSRLIRPRSCWCCRTGPTPPAWHWRGRPAFAAEAIDHRRFGRDRAAHEAAIDAALRAAGVEIVCLAGYMRLLTPFLVDALARAGC